MLTTNDRATDYTECDACHAKGARMLETVTGGCYCNDLCARRDHVKASPAFLAISREALRIGWPTSYRRDLTLHDRRELARHDDAEPCIWIVRDMGTHLIFPGGQPAHVPTDTLNGWHFKAVSAADLTRSVISVWDNDRTRCYVWDGSTLLAVSNEEAIAAATRWEREAMKARRVAA